MGHGSTWNWGASLALLSLLGLVSTGCPAAMAPPVGDQIEVQVFGDGTGVGRVNAPLAMVQIDCLLGANVPDSGSCFDEFSDIGDGGEFTLIAQANPGSTFEGWSGCNSVNGNECVLTFEEGNDVTFMVTATFDTDASNACNMTFGTSQGYVLCSESDTRCTFYALLNDVDSCTSRCASFSTTCSGSLRDTNDTCTPGEAGSCDEIVGDRLCVCDKP